MTKFTLLGHDIEITKDPQWEHKVTLFNCPPPKKEARLHTVTAKGIINVKKWIYARNIATAYLYSIEGTPVLAWYESDKL